MKRVIFTSACLALLFTSCKKEDVSSTPEESPAAIQLPTTSGYYVSDWESPDASSWDVTASGSENISYKYNRSTPEVNSSVMRGGTVMAFAKGYNFADANMNRPLGLPFTFFSPFERMAHPYNWSVDKEQGKIKLAVDMYKSMAGEFAQSQNGIKMRYVVLSPTYFAQTGTTPQALSRMTYTELMDELHTQP